MEDAERAVTFVYHLALCALNTSLVSGAMAERWWLAISLVPLNIPNLPG